MTARLVAFLSVCAAALAARSSHAGEVHDATPAPSHEAHAPADSGSSQASPAPAAETPAEHAPAAEPVQTTSAPAAAPATPSTNSPAPEAGDVELTTRTHVSHKQSRHSATPEEIASLLRIGHAKRDQGDYASAEIAFMQVLAETATTDQDREALLGLGRTYRKKGDFTKATAVLERFAKNFPTDPELPAVYLDLGRTLRALGSYKQAIARFYSVLNTTLKLPEEGAETYRQLARTAQFEIAETHFQIGDYEQANRFFSRLKLLDLAPEDRARAHFKSVFALTLAKEDEKAVSGLTHFLEQYPDDENVPEARYLLSVALRRQGRSDESLRATLELLKVENSRAQKDTRRWAYWQRKTGNQLANEFYQAGDIPSALLIYQNLAALSSDPSWNLPVTYQIGLCHERLRRYDRARECYRTIVQAVTQAAPEAPRRPELADLGEMAAWRLGQLDWQERTESQLSSVFTSTPAAPATPASTPKPTTASASDYDSHGSAPIASQFVR